MYVKFFENDKNGELLRLSVGSTISCNNQILTRIAGTNVYTYEVIGSIMPHLEFEWIDANGISRQNVVDAIPIELPINLPDTIHHSTPYNLVWVGDPVGSQEIISNDFLGGIGTRTVGDTSIYYDLSDSTSFHNNYHKSHYCLIRRFKIQRQQDSTNAGGYIQTLYSSEMDSVYIN